MLILRIIKVSIFVILGNVDSKLEIIKMSVVKIFASWLTKLNSYVK